MKLVPFKTREEQARPGLIDALEKLLADAKAGKVHRAVIVCTDEITGCTHRVMHRAVDTNVIGGLSCTLVELQRLWNEQD